MRGSMKDKDSNRVRNGCRSCDQAMTQIKFMAEEIKRTTYFENAEEV
jgi:hypothetical protein